MSTIRLCLAALALLSALLAGRSSEPPSKPPPGPQPRRADKPDPNKVKEAEARAAEVIKRAGGKVVRKGGRIVEVSLLKFDGAAFTDADVKLLGGLTRLRKLNLLNTPVTDAGVSELKSLAALEELAVGSMNAFKRSKITGATLKQLSGLRRLTTLELWPCQLTDKGLKDIAGLAGLKKLILKEALITDAALKDVARLKGLEVLDLNGAKKVTDAGLRELLVLDKLHTLRISDTGVTDAGLRDLATLKSLDTIFLVACKVTAEGVKKFKAAKPKCTVFK